MCVTAEEYRGTIIPLWTCASALLSPVKYPPTLSYVILTLQVDTAVVPQFTDETTEVKWLPQSHRTRKQEHQALNPGGLVPESGHPTLVMD